MARRTQTEPEPDEPQPGDGEVTAIEDGQLLDIISGEQVKDTPKERVRQRIARALFREYGIPIDCMEGDFTVPVSGEGQRRRRIKVDIAIFRTPRVADTARDLEDLVRVVSCQPEPKAKGKNTVTKLRDHEAAQSDLNDIKCVMEAAPRCEWGLWTNNLDFFFLRKDTKSSRFEVRFNPVGDWEPWDSSVATRDVASTSRMRRADPDMLRVAFRRCHNFIHGNQGMSKDKAFWQFLYLIFCKMHDEQRSNGHRRFWAAPSEQFEAAGQQAIRERVLPLFAEVKKKYHGTGIFRDSDEITLNAKALAFMVSELSRYDLSRTDVDAKGA
ncbi:MAG: restriction endonuclease subunit M, partial [Planctomycetia bacterium]|nr:restriction endonuclease subunit M [Planctomycetia bacterium]